MRLSVLDLSPIPSGSTAHDALENTLDLAKHVESLGYERVWLAEHHNAGGLASSAPEIVIGQVARVTNRIRVGSGGIMLPNHAPLKVAETFRVLSAFFPGRIDLGNRARTGDRSAHGARASARRTRNPILDTSLDALVSYLDHDGPPREAFAASTIATPVGVPEAAAKCSCSARATAALRTRPSAAFRSRSRITSIRPTRSR